MSLNIGEGASRFISVFDVTVKMNYSDKVAFANLTSSKKVDLYKLKAGDNGISTDGKPINARTYYRWKGRFVGNAFEYAKGLRQGQQIDIINGWIESEKYVDKNGVSQMSYYVVISDFRVSDLEDFEEDGGSVDGC